MRSRGQTTYAVPKIRYISADIRELRISDNIRCTENTIYIGGYSGTADIDYAFSVYDAETETFKHLDRFRNYKGDVTSAYLGKSRICAAYIKENESYFVVCDGGL